MLWFTADTHFGHSKIIQYCSRPFASVEEMDAELVSRWNARISPRDEVWHLGDFCFRGDPSVYFRQLNGRVSFILGNHDDPKKLGPLVDGRVYDVKYLRSDGKRFFLSHYAHRTWPQSGHSSFHLYGHSHGDMPGLGCSMDVGVDCHGYEPISMQCVVTTLEAAEPTAHHLERVLE